MRTLKGSQGRGVLPARGALNDCQCESGSLKGSGLRLQQEGPTERQGALQKGREFKKKAGWLFVPEKVVYIPGSRIPLARP